MIAVLLGAPGAGKGTQAQLAAESQGWTHLSTGDLLRSEVAAGTELGEQANAYMSKGDLVPDELMVAMVVSRMHVTLDGRMAHLRTVEDYAATGATRITLGTKEETWLRMRPRAASA